MTDLKKLRELAKDFERKLSNDFGLQEAIESGALFHDAANPQAIIDLLDRLERYEKALRSCEVRSGHIENWHRDHVTPDNFKDCQDVGVTPEAYLRETKMIAREALEGGK